MFVIKKLDTVNEIQKLARLAEVIWHEHFPGLISEEQINYMVAQFQSESAIRDQLENKG